MWPDLLAGLPPLWLIAGAFLIAGTVKGVAGVGLPMTALGILTIQTEPRIAITLSLVPIFLSNIWQVLNAGGGFDAIRRYFPFLACLVIGIFLTLRLTAGVDPTFLFAMLGIVFLAFVALRITDWSPRISDARDLPAQIGFGSLAGLLGGLTSLWLPAIVIYLAARDVKKEEFVRASGLMLVIGSVPLVSGYWREGFLTGPLTLVSAALVVPTLIGMALGARVRHRLSEEAFRRVLLVVFALIGLNLLRRAIMG